MSTILFIPPRHYECHCSSFVQCFEAVDDIPAIGVDVILIYPDFVKRPANDEDRWDSFMTVHNCSHQVRCDIMRSLMTAYDESTFVDSESEGRQK